MYNNSNREELSTQFFWCGVPTILGRRESRASAIGLVYMPTRAPDRLVGWWFKVYYRSRIHCLIKDILLKFVAKMITDRHSVSISAARLVSQEALSDKHR